MREARYVSLIPWTTLHSDSEQIFLVPLRNSIHMVMDAEMDTDMETILRHKNRHHGNGKDLLRIPIALQGEPMISPKDARKLQPHP
jgi:hypothetical protein